jgi:hypothetical protein
MSGGAKDSNYGLTKSEFEVVVFLLADALILRHLKTTNPQLTLNLEIGIYGSAASNAIIK